MIYKYLLYVYLKWVKEDHTILNNAGKIIIYPAWFIRSCLVWILSFIFFPAVLLNMWYDENYKDDIQNKINKLKIEVYNWMEQNKVNI